MSMYQACCRKGNASQTADSIYICIHAGYVYMPTSAHNPTIATQHHVAGWHSSWTQTGHGQLRDSHVLLRAEVQTYSLLREILVSFCLEIADRCTLYVPEVTKSKFLQAFARFSALSASSEVGKH